MQADLAIAKRDNALAAFEGQGRRAAQGPARAYRRIAGFRQGLRRSGQRQTGQRRAAVRSREALYA